MILRFCSKEVVSVSENEIAENSVDLVCGCLARGFFANGFLTLTDTFLNLSFSTAGPLKNPIRDESLNDFISKPAQLS